MNNPIAPTESPVPAFGWRARRLKRTVSPALVIAAALALGHAIQCNNGGYDPRAFVWLTVGVLLAWSGLSDWGGRLLGGGPRLTPFIVCLAGIFWQAIQGFQHAPLSVDVHVRRFHYLALPLLLIAALIALFPSRWQRKAFVPMLLAIYFAAGAWLMHLSPAPHIDVFEVTRDACVAITHGRNPYAIDFPYIYTQSTDDPRWEREFYPPGFVYDGRVHFGYQYMPLGFAIDLGGHVIAGDFRLGNLAAITIAAGLIACCPRRPSWLAAAAAGILLLTPRNYYVIEQGWSEPPVVLTMALVIFCAARRSRWLPWTVGLFLVSKQHMILAAPAAALLLPWPWRWKTSLPFITRAAIAAIVVTAPLALWNPRAFWKSVIQVQMANPFRFDSLNFAAAWARLGHAPLPGWMAFAAAIFAGLIVLRYAPRSPAGFAWGVAVIYLALFFLAKQAFCNYYFMIIGALCCAAAASEWNDSEKGNGNAAELTIPH